MVEPTHILPVANDLGESILWDGRSSEALWTDILGRRFWRWRDGEAEANHFDLPQRLGSFALTPTRGTYLGAFEDGFAQFTPRSSSFEMQAPVTQPDEHLRLNDGRVDREGVFWAGSMAESASPAADGVGQLWRYEGAGTAKAHLDGLRIPNSLCWSLDGRTMYFADSPSRRIWAYDFRDGAPQGEPRLFAQTPEGIDPDGSCIDADDHLWNAHWGAGEVVRYEPNGRIVFRLKLPVSQPTCVTFGGAGYDRLFVTSARTGLTPEMLAQEPLAGALFIYDLKIKGVPETICTRL